MGEGKSELTPAERATVEALDAMAAKPKTPRKSGQAKGDSGDRDAQGRITGRSKLTERQALFVTELRKGVAQTEAAKRAGYGSPAVAASRMLKAGTVAELVKRGRERIIRQSAAAGVQLMAATILGKANPTRIQFDAARFMIEQAKTIAGEGENTNDISNLRELPLHKLEAMAARISGAKEVATVPELPAEHVQVVDNAATSSPLIRDSGEPDGEGGPVE